MSSGPKIPKGFVQYPKLGVRPGTDTYWEVFGPKVVGLNVRVTTSYGGLSPELNGERLEASLLEDLGFVATNKGLLSDLGLDDWSVLPIYKDPDADCCIY